MKTGALALLLLAANAALAADNEFERIVKAVESHYGTKQLHIPFMGLANLAVKIARPDGATGFKLAVFEDLHSSPDEREWKERDQFMESVSGPRLHPMVRVHSRRGGEATYIFMNPDGSSARILIATFQRNEATVVEVKANIDALLHALEDPDRAGHALTE